MDIQNLSAGTIQKPNVLIEIAQGTNIKYEFDEASGLLKLDFMYSDSLVFPFNYGFIPNTKSQDNDPLDAMVFSSKPLVIYTLAEVQPFGLLRLKDRGEQDNKLLVVPTVDPLAGKYRDIGDFDELLQNRLLDFWRQVGQEKHKSMEFEGFFGRAEALAEIKLCRLP